MPNIFVRPAVLFGLLVMVACGGGTSGGGDGSGSIPPPSAPTPPPAPPPPGPGGAPDRPGFAYSGNIDPAEVTESNAVRLAELTHRMHYLIRDEGIRIEGLPNFGPGSGQTAWSGKMAGRASAKYDIAADGTGWVDVTYTAYRDVDEIYDGRRALVVRQINRNNGLEIDASSYFDHLSVRGGHWGEAEFTGEVRRQRRHQSNGWRDVFMVDLLVEEALSIGPYAVWIRNAGLEILESAADASPVARGSFSGRIYHSAVGWINVTTPEELQYSMSGYPRLEHGEFAIRSTGAGVEAGLVGRHLLSVGFEGLADGIIYSAARLDLDTYFGESPLGPGDVLFAHAGHDLTLPVGQPVTLDGRRSFRGANTMIHFSWRLVSAPPGAKAVIVGRDSPRARLVTATPGRYRVELAVIDEQSHARDVVEIHLLPETEAVEETHVRFGMDRDTHAGGSTLDIDARAEEKPNWYVFQSPPGSTTPVGPVNVKDRAARVLLDLPGLYAVGPADSSGRRRVLIGADQPMFYDPRPYLGEFGESSSASLALAFADVDVDGNGGSDIVRLIQDSDASLTGYRIAIRRRGLNGNSEEDIIDRPDFPGTLAAGDISGDGRSDVVYAADGRIMAYLQNASGGFEGASTLPRSASECEAPDTLDVQLADLNGDGRLDLLSGPHCGNTVEVRYQRSDGSLDLPVVLGLAGAGATLRQFVLPGYDFQSRADIYASSDAGLHWLRGVNVGGSADPVMLPMADCGSIEVADLGWDGKRELIAHCGSTLYIFEARDEGLEMRQRWDSLLEAGSAKVHVTELLDNRPSIVIAQGARVTVIPGKGFRDFHDPVVMSIWDTEGSNNSYFADYDGDGHQDLLVIDPSGLKIYFPRY